MHSVSKDAFRLTDGTEESRLSLNERLQILKEKQGFRQA